MVKIPESQINLALPIGLQHAFREELKVYMQKRRIKLVNEPIKLYIAYYQPKRRKIVKDLDKKIVKLLYEVTQREYSSSE